MSEARQPPPGHHGPISARAGVAIAGTVVAVLGAMLPLMLAVGNGIYSSVRQCNQDASDLETRLTSILLEISDREVRIRSLLASEDAAVDKLPSELVQIETGADAHFGDPAFKDFSLVSLVNQYNRSLRRVTFPPACPAGTIPRCLTVTDLKIDTQKIHPAIQTLDVNGEKAHAFRSDIDKDLVEVEKQQEWHKIYGPVRLCSNLRAVFGASEPWKLIELRPRAD